MKLMKVSILNLVVLGIVIVAMVGKGGRWLARESGRMENEESCSFLRENN